MNTKNHKPATTSDILNNPEIQESTNPSPSSTTNPSIQKSTNPFPLRGRCGKVARLPKEIRDQINEMLLDGVPHAQIIQKLRENFGTPPSPDSNVVPYPAPATQDLSLAPSDGERARVRGSSTAPDCTNHAPRNTEHDSPSAPDTQPSPSSIENPKSKIQNLDSLTPHHITTWKKYGGYRDWLRDQQRLQECKLRHELTLDLARSAEGLASYQAAPKVAVAQICQTIIDIGPEGLKEAMKDSPLNCFRLLNALARLINSGLKCENQIHKAANAADDQNRQPVGRADLRRVEQELNLL